MADYSKTIIYKLCCKDPDVEDVYVGSTTNFRTRKNEHKSRCNNQSSSHYNFHVYQFIREHGGWDNFDMIQIEEYPCKSKREKEARERYYVEQLKAKLNMKLPQRSKQEYYNDNKEILKEKSREKYNNNKEEYNQRAKKYYEKNRESIMAKVKEYAETNKEKIAESHRKYQDANRERLREYHKQYYQQNKIKWQRNATPISD